ncbi:MAG: DUF4249 domain-containing protein [Reichenbachiella sp.]|uniref:DUF4249 domain-containing protein n=1 Tax=Reichenbachiella sp. TaxID=2184521 RepID=UPI00329A5A37
MKHYLYLLCALAVMSCETVSDIEIGVTSNKLDLRGELNSDSVIQVALLSTRITTDNLIDPYRLKSEAEVSLFRDGEFVETLVRKARTYEGEFETYYLSSSGLKPETGSMYSVEISASGFESIRAETVVPAQVNVTDIEFLRQQTPITNGYYGHPVTIWFEDDPDVENFFIVETYLKSIYEERRDNGDGNIEIYQEINDYKTEIAPRTYYGKGIGDDNPFEFEIYFSDAQLDGGSVKRFDFFIRTYEDGLDPFLGKDEISDDSYTYTTKMYVRLKHITKEHFEYKRTALAQMNKIEDPFAEPVLIRSNVEGGFGIFSVYTSADSKEISD